MIESVNEISPELLRQLVEEIQDAPGVDFSAKEGGICPLCGTAKCRVSTSGPWTGSVRERFHKCRNCGLRFKSVQTA